MTTLPTAGWSGGRRPSSATGGSRLAKPSPDATPRGEDAPFAG